ncbi:MAG: TIGR00282 family metallophosphoesterase [Nitrospinota bacterium]|nr:TIGR00282 family metallophosphoesterase [Nitrospinota bacterium]
MRILAIGDIFGRVGRRTLKQGLANIIAMTKVDFVMANGENLAGGFGITRDTVEEVFSLGVDVMTSGNHIWDKKEALQLLETHKNILRPANYPARSPGKGSGVYQSKSGKPVGVINLQGRVFMDALNCPFVQAEQELEKVSSQTKVILVDMHAEATSEKIAMGYLLDGRVSAILGTHTHVQTADAKILPRGSAYISDLGMTGPSHSIIGVQPEIIMKRFLMKLPERFSEAMGPGQFNGVVMEVDEGTGLAKSIEPLRVNYEETQ